MTIPSAVMCAVLAIGTALFVDAAYRANQPVPAPFGEEHALHDLKVLALGKDDFHYEFQDERNNIFWAHFCHDYEPQFAPGMTLNVLTYQDYGECWSVKNTHPAYLIKRDKKGKIIEEDFHAERQGPQAR